MQSGLEKEEESDGEGREETLRSPFSRRRQRETWRREEIITSHFIWPPPQSQSPLPPSLSVSAFGERRRSDSLEGDENVEEEEGAEDGQCSGDFVEGDREGEREGDR